MNGTNYKVESEVRKPGQVMNLPEAASTLSVEPVGSGFVRVTYLKPVREITVQSPSDVDEAMAFD